MIENNLMHNYRGGLNKLRSAQTMKYFDNTYCVCKYFKKYIYI